MAESKEIIEFRVKKGILEKIAKNVICENCKIVPREPPIFMSAQRFVICSTCKPKYYLQGKDLFDRTHNPSHLTLYTDVLKIKTIIVVKKNWPKNVICLLITNPFLATLYIGCPGSRVTIVLYSLYSDDIHMNHIIDQILG